MQKNIFNKLISSIYYNSLYTSIFPTLSHQLKKELQDCSTVLDLGCGPSSPIQYCKNVRYSVGVEPFGKYLLMSKKQKIHNRYLNAKIEDLNFPDRTFDAVIMIEVLEHLPRDIGKKILLKIEKWAKNKVVVTSPNGFLAQPAVDKNQLQKHLSGWSVATMQRLGYQVVGLEGLKFLRKDPLSSEYGNILATIRFQPRFFWFVIVNLSQVLTYYLPRHAFAWFGVKNLKNKKLQF